MKHDFPHLIEFYGKHALGSMLAPSCLCCGQSTKDRKIGIKHMELPGVVICEPCAQAARSAPRPVLTEDTKRLDWLERNKCIGISHEWQGDDDYLWCVYRVGGSPNDRDIKHAGEADTLRAAIDAAIERAVRDGGGNNG